MDISTVVGTVLVCTDGAPRSMPAVRWAAREAELRGATLRVAHAYDWNWDAARFDTAQEYQHLARAHADQIIAEALDQVRAIAPSIRFSTDAIVGEPAPALLKAAEQASLVVLGNRGRGGFASLLLGSVSQRVATHAPCPVIVVRGRTDAVDGPVVVGVDIAAKSGDLLAVAFEEATRRGTPLIAVHAYPSPVPPYVPGMSPLEYDFEGRDATERAELDAALSPWRIKYPHVPVEALVAHGGPAAVLVGVSHTAQLVVVGSRGIGALAGTLLGSTGLQLLHHAECPVLIVRPRPDESDPITSKEEP